MPKDKTPHAICYFEGDENYAENLYSYNLRDYFAAMAMQGLLSSGASNGIAARSDGNDTIQKMAYKVADAMLEERGK